MKTSIVLFFLLLFAACNPKAPEAQKTSSAIGDGKGNSSGSNGGAVVSESAPVVRVMNYNQYNQTLSKLTGINQKFVASLFNDLRGSLPADNDIQALTSFNLVAKTRLADAYCSKYVTDNAVVMNSATSRDELMEKFLDYNPASSDDAEKYDSLIDQLDDVIANKGGILVSANDANKAVAGCIIILASSYITLLE